VTTVSQRRIPAVTIVVSLVLCVAGLAIATYLTIEHFDTGLQLACPDTGRINCQRVTTSQYSHVLGIPVVVLGLLYFVVALALMLPQAWRSTAPAVRWSRVGWVTIGLLMVLYLVWAEFFGVSAICLWCTSIHVITFLLFILVALTEAWVIPVGDAESVA
jgi:uncharacterized membrane protein